MGMYIIGGKPDRCGVCPCFHAENPMYCQAVKAAVQKPRIVRPYANGRPDWCPLIEVPEPHGDLIDRQKLLEDNKHLEYPTDGKYRRDRAWSVGFNAGAKHANEHVYYSKTIIPASEEAE